MHNIPEKCSIYVIIILIAAGNAKYYPSRRLICEWKDIHKTNNQILRSTYMQQIQYIFSWLLGLFLFLFIYINTRFACVKGKPFWKVGQILVIIFLVLARGSISQLRHLDRGEEDGYKLFFWLSHLKFSKKFVSFFYKFCKLWLFSATIREMNSKQVLSNMLKSTQKFQY